MEKNKCFIFDIDGTLSKSNGRDWYNPKPEQILQDSLIQPVADVLIALEAIGHDIIFLSGREDKFREATKDWLFQNLDIENPRLFMRNTGDFRKDSIIKLEIYNEYIKPNWDVIAVFDDRLQVCRMWYEQNIFCFNVNQGLKEF